jgi:hypothetical protein
MNHSSSSSAEQNGHAVEEFWQQWKANAPKREEQIADRLKELKTLHQEKSGILFGRTGHTSPNAGR